MFDFLQVQLWLLQEWGWAGSAFVGVLCAQLLMQDRLSTPSSYQKESGPIKMGIGKYKPQCMEGFSSMTGGLLMLCRRILALMEVACNGSFFLAESGMCH